MLLVQQHPIEFNVKGFFIIQNKTLLKVKLTQTILRFYQIDWNFFPVDCSYCDVHDIFYSICRHEID